MPEGLKYRYVPNIVLVYAKFGSKRGGERSLHMLPQRFELGEGWRQLGEHTWRTGRMGKASDWAVRARKLKSVTAIRSFEQATASRSLTTQVVPAASESDAAIFVNGHARPTSAQSPRQSDRHQRTSRKRHRGARRAAHLGLRTRNGWPCYLFRYRLGIRGHMVLG
jgi:hypothetical protein